jgi:hypothetical protein
VEIPVAKVLPITYRADVGFVVPMPIAAALRIFLLSSIILTLEILKAISIIPYSSGFYLLLLFITQVILI